MLKVPTPPAQAMLPVPVHVAPKLLLTVRCPIPFKVAPPIASAPLALVMPVPSLLPPVQLKEPLTSNVPVPVSVPLLNARLVTPAAALSVHVPPFAIAASSEGPGGP